MLLSQGSSMAQREWTLASLPFLADTFVFSFEELSHKITFIWQMRRTFMSPAVKGWWWQGTSPILSCHSSKQSVFLLLGDTQLRGRPWCSLWTGEGFYDHPAHTLHFTLAHIREWPAGGSVQISSGEGQPLCGHALPWAQDFPARGSIHQPRFSSSVLITSICPEGFPPKDFKPKALAQPWHWAILPLGSEL